MNALELQRANYLNALIRRLENSPHGERSQLLDDATAYLGCSRSQLYSRLRQLGWDSGRKSRTDKGSCLLSREEAAWVSNLLIQSCRDSGKQLLSVRDAVELAYANGKLRQRVSEATASRAMRRYKMHPEQLKHAISTVQMRSLHPNHVWQFDVSLCVLYYLKNQQGLRVMEQDKFYKNKPFNLERIKNERVLRYLVTDHFSGAFHLAYYVAPGENVETLTKFLLEAFTKRGREELLHGVPQILIWDAGSANQAHQTKHLLDKLGVKHHAHVPGCPWAKGQVESTHNVIERKFESRLSFCRVDTIEALNEMATTWSVSFQSTQVHSRHRQTRYGLWQTIRPQQLRVIADMAMLRAALQQTKPAVRKVKPQQLKIAFAPKGYKTMEYSLAHIPGICAGDEVQVTINPYRSPAVDITTWDDQGEPHMFSAEPIETDTAGFALDAPVFGQGYQSMPKTRAARHAEEADRRAYGTAERSELKKVRKSQPAFGGDIDPLADVRALSLPAHVQRPGTQLEIDAAAIPQAVRLPVTVALRRIRDALRLPPVQMRALNQFVRKHYTEGLDDIEIEQLIDQLEAGDVYLAETAT